MTTIILIRHGESEANRKNIFAGQINPDLHQRGLEQARLTAKYVAENYSVDKIYASDLRRAFKTAECLGELLGQEVIPCKGMREISAGRWENMIFDNIRIEYPKEFELWYNNIGESYCPEGETMRDMSRRIMIALEDIARQNDGKTVAVGTHATPVRIAQSVASTGGIERMAEIPWASNASVTVITYTNGKWELVTASEDRHLSSIKTELPKNI